ncbi:MAG TPA: response regulator, partial [Agriterribacter sp.]|nr:response regulator [Agriterribacter sp.]
PDGLGIDFIQFIKSRYPGSKIIMITAHDSPAEHRRAYMEGVDIFIPKPFTKENIRSAISQVTT